MQTKTFNTMPQWGAHPYQRAMTYNWCKDLYSRKRGTYRRLGSNAYLRLNTDAAGALSYEVWYGKPREPSEVALRQYCKPVARVHPDDSVEVMYLADQGERTLLSDAVGMTFFRKADVRSNCMYWVGGRAGPAAIFPAHVGMKIKGGAILTPAPAIEKRTVNRETAKPVRQMLADWKKRLEIVVLLRSEDYKKEVDWKTRGSLRHYEPNVVDTFNAETAHMMLLKARLSTDAMRYVYDYGTGVGKYEPLPDFEKRLIKRAIDLFRDPVYKHHGVYEWKEAA